MFSGSRRWNAAQVHLSCCVVAYEGCVKPVCRIDLRSAIYPSPNRFIHAGLLQKLAANLIADHAPDSAIDVAAKTDFVLVPCLDCTFKLREKNLQLL